MELIYVARANIKGRASITALYTAGKVSESLSFTEILIPLIFSDELNNLWEEYIRLSQTNNKFSNADVSTAYFGPKSTTRTMTMFASVAIRLHRTVLYLIEEICIHEHPGLRFTKKLLNMITTQIMINISYRIVTSISPLSNFNRRILQLQLWQY